MDDLDETTDGPDVARARARLVEVRSDTAETDVILAESRRLSIVVQGHGRRNHFAEKFRSIIQGTS